MPIQQMLLGAGGGAVATKTYVDDIFSTFLYKGTGSSQAINNGIDLSSEGGMTWVKERNNSSYHFLTDTVRGFKTTDNSGNPMSPEGYSIFSNDSAAQSNYNGITAFNSNGFSLGTDSDFNANGDQYASWTFRKAPGFFDVVTYTGNGTSGRDIAHSLGSVPGCIMVKNLDNIRNWAVYHASVGNGKYLNLNLTSDASTNTDRWNDTTPTSSVFTVGNNADTNGDGIDYVAYLFAGGEEGYNSVKFDGTGDYLNLGSSTDFEMGTGDFTVECFVKIASAGTKGVFQISTTSGGIGTGYQTSLALGWDNNYWQVYSAGGATGSSSFSLSLNNWYHVALVRSSGVTKLYVDGVEKMSTTDTYDYQGTNLAIGGYYSTSNLMNGDISNFRVVKGTAVYTSSFTPPTAPLTNITNTKLLCCNGDLTTSSTVTPGTITANGNPNTTGTSPLTSPDAVFGDAGDQGIIKCGSYVGNGNTNGPEIFLGHEPQWVLTKSSSGSYNWQMYDSMRGIVTGGNDPWLEPNTSDAEASSLNWLDLTSRGFKITESLNAVNKSGDTYIYIAIRRPDGYVGKPPELGTGVFAMDVGNGSTTIPAFDSGFPVDMNMNRKPASTWSWQLGTRLQGKDQLNPNTNDAEGGELAKYVWDSNAGFGADSGYDSSYQSWMWKRHAGFDVVTYIGDGVSGRQIPHSLNKTIEMMWVKNRGASEHWAVYHKGLNGGTNPEQYFIKLDENEAEYGSNNSMWNSTAPTSTHFTLGDWDEMNADSGNHIAMLFASVDGISKVGSFVIDGSQNAITVTTGFQPRFVIYKNIDTSYDWWTHDTVRGWGSGDDKALKLNSNTSNTEWDTGAPTSTGFTLVSGYTSGNYIYYAHA